MGLYELLITTFIAALITDLATGLGAVPFFFVRDLSARLEGAFTATAAGMMIAASLIQLVGEEKPEAAFAVNATAVRHLAAACHARSARLIHISTDYVFGYGGARPYTEADLPAPLSIYGASKLAGEYLVAAEMDDYAVVRSSGLYGKSVY